MGYEFRRERGWRERRVPLAVVACSPVDMEEELDAPIIAEQVLALLRPRHRNILRLRFGLEDGRMHSRGEVAAEHCMTTERVRQIEIKAIRDMRQGCLWAWMQKFLP